MTVPDLSIPRKVHVVGAGGAAMSAIAHILHREGHRVTGSDQSAGTAVDALGREGITVHVGHDPANLGDADLVAVSTAVRTDNPELAAARTRSIEVATRPEMMEALSAGRRCAVISGTHGKTSTTAMTVVMLQAARFSPSFLVGGIVRQLGTGVGWEPSSWFVAEGDESDGAFLRFSAEAVVVTNLEPDHLDYWHSMDALEAAFDRFVAGARVAVVCADDEGARALTARARAAGATHLTTYGFADDADHRIESLGVVDGRDRFVVTDGPFAQELVLPSAGRHMVRNATAAFTLGRLLGADPQPMASALSSFAGTGRRYERRGEAGGITFVDDYAHLPTEVAANVATAAEYGWGRVVAVFQPHRYTRTHALAADFGPAFAGADLVVVTGIYGAGQTPIPGVSGELVADAVRRADPAQRVVYCETLEETRRFLLGELRPGDLCLTMNAGDLTALPDELIGVLGERVVGERVVGERVVGERVVGERVVGEPAL